MNVVPDLLLIYYDNAPKNKDAFFKSLFADLHVSVGPATIIMYYQDSDAATLTEVLPDATVIGCVP